MDEFLYDDAEDVLVDSEVKEIETAAKDVLVPVSSDIDDIAGIDSDNLDQYEDDDEDNEYDGIDYYEDDDQDYVDYEYDTDDEDYEDEEYDID
jgi:hypothetical protein